VTANPDLSNLLVRGGKIFGGPAPAAPEWCEAVLVREGKVTAVGGSDELRSEAGEIREVDLDGALLLPGLCDAHMHMASGGASIGKVVLAGLDLTGVQQALREAATDWRKGETSWNKTCDWIEATNWEPARCRLEASVLDQITSERPLLVFSRDRHSCCCNSAALKLTGITADTPDPPGGAIGRSSGSRPNGLLYENAIGLVVAALPESDTATWRRFILEAQEYLLSLGLTAVSEVLTSGTETVFRDLDRSGELILDIDGWLRIENWSTGEPPPPDGDRFHLRTIKLLLDGAFGSGTAALEQPFTDSPDSNGMLLYSDEELIELVLPAVKASWRLALHSIGDRAVAQACRILARLPRVDSAPHRIEHVQLLPEEGIQSLVRSGATASVQPVHLIDDQPWLPLRIGAERCRRSFVWRSLLDAGVTVALGSDWPIASADPLLNLHAAINRCGFNQEPQPDFDLAEALPPYDAVRAATHGWAAAAGGQGHRGSIVPGQTADFTAVAGVSEDLRDWSGAEVTMTFCQGKAVFQK